MCILHPHWIHRFPQLASLHILQLHSELQSTATFNQGVGTSAGQMAPTRCSRGSSAEKKYVLKFTFVSTARQAVLLWNTLLIPMQFLDWFSWAWRSEQEFNSLPSPAIHESWLATWSWICFSNVLPGDWIQLAWFFMPNWFRGPPGWKWFFISNLSPPPGGFEPGCVHLVQKTAIP